MPINPDTKENCNYVVLFDSEQNFQKENFDGNNSTKDDKKLPKISVIVPVYNVEEFVAQCLDSIINQTYKNLEIICIDDCGSDKSVDIIKNYIQKDKRIKLLRHKSNYGLAVSRNTGLDYSVGDYVFFLDSDDYLCTSDVIEKCYNKITTDNSDIVTGRAKAFTKESEHIKRVREYNDCFSLPIQTVKLQVNLDNFDKFYDTISHVSWGRLYRASFLKNNNIKFVNKHYICEDEGFFIKVYSSFPLISFIENITVMYRIRKNSIITNVVNKKDIRNKTRHVKCVINDALNYIKKEKRLCNELIKKIKSSDVFQCYFNIEIPFILKYNPRYKNLYLFKCEIFRRKQISEDKVQYRVLGIVVKEEYLPMGG